MICNTFTVDLEEWFHILDIEGAGGLERWDTLPSRVEAQTEGLLELLEESGVRATFFVLGWVAERHSGLVRQVAAAGHEIASHGYGHRLLFEGGRDAFVEDTHRAKAVTEEILGGPVAGYRAAGFSLTRETPWAFDVLVEEGFRYDSSIFPAPRAHGGLDLGRVRPFRLTAPGGGGLWEFPIPPVRVASLPVAFSGGGYLRLWPLPLIRWAERALNRREVPVNYYIHPREIDPEQPRMSLPLKRRFKYYVNLAGTREKLRGLLRGEPGRPAFRTLGERLTGLESAEEAADAPVRIT